jgi:hypothetical protein
MLDRSWMLDRSLCLFAQVRAWFPHSGSTDQAANVRRLEDAAMGLVRSRLFDARDLIRSDE